MGTEILISYPPSRHYKRVAEGLQLLALGANAYYLCHTFSRGCKAPLAEYMFHQGIHVSPPGSQDLCHIGIAPAP